MANRYFDVGDHTYFVVPAGEPDGFVILDLTRDCEAVDEHGQVYEDDGAEGHLYATEREAEEAIERWRIAEDDRRQFEAMRRVMRKGIDDPATHPSVKALVNAMFPPSDR